MSTPPNSPQTLPSLLRRVINVIEQDYLDAGAVRGELPSLDLWENLLRAVDEAGVDPRELPIHLRLSKRALRTRLGAAVRQGWIQETAAGERGSVRLTRRGVEVVRRWPAVQSEAEMRGRNRIGDEAAVRLRTRLESMASKLPLEYPHYPARYGPADASVTGGPGRDWKAVPRDAKGDLANLPTVALVSQLLMSFAMEYETMSPVAFSHTATILTHMPPEGRPVHGLGHAPDISALTRHGYITVSDTGVARLTPRGRSACDAHDSRIAAVEQMWIDRFGASAVEDLRTVLQTALDARRSK